MDSPAALGSSALPCHVCFGRAFVEEDKPIRVEPGLPPPPTPPGLDDVRSILFARPERLFLYVSPMSTST